jgi:nucleotidyltransferase/DNA polymerase involved in DNA repair
MPFTHLLSKGITQIIEESLLRWVEQVPGEWLQLQAMKPESTVYTQQCLLKLQKRSVRLLFFVRPRFDVYKQVSNQIRQIFLEYTDLVEPLSLDEAYLDVTQHKRGKPSATLIAKEIKQRIKAETGLTASAGISINKFLAKTASDYRKPDGLFLIKPEDAEAFVEQLPIEKFFGIGKVSAEKCTGSAFLMVWT